MSENKENQIPSKLQQSNVDDRYVTESENDCSFTTAGFKSQKSFSKGQQSQSLHNDSTMIAESSFWHLPTDDSFEQLEKMCNKTLSDPNSTLSQYVKKMQQNKPTVNTEDDEETRALNRLLKDLNFQAKFADQTQLTGVEPPSFLLENTLNLDTTQNYGISPTKKVGLNRPSTILEESGDDYSRNSNDASSVFSFKTSKTGKSTDYTYETCPASDHFDTADENNLKKSLPKEDNPCHDIVTDNSCSSNDSLEIKSDNVKSLVEIGEQSLIDDISLKLSENDSLNEVHSNVSGTNENSDVNRRDTRNFETRGFVSKDSYVMPNIYNRFQENSISVHMSVNSSDCKSEDLFPYRKRVFNVDLMNLEKYSPHTLKSNKSSQPTSTFSSIDHTKSTLDEVSSICDDSLENRSKSKNYSSSYIPEDSLEKSSINSRKVQDIHKERRQFKYFDMPKRDHDFSGVIELSDDDTNNSTENADLNEGFSMNKNEIDSFESNNSLNVSREFNDTIEEMEYIMQEGIKYMAKNGNVPKIIDNITLNYHASPRSEYSRGETSSQKNTPPTLVKNKNLTYNVNSKIPIQKSVEKTKNHQQLKTNSDFKKPIARPQQQQNKTGTVKKIPSSFAHIVSPVAEYIKNTPTTPLIMNMKPCNDLFKSKIVKDLEREYQEQERTTYNSPTNLERNLKDSPKIRKAIYRPAEHKQIKDERGCRVIPGGDKLHKYFQPTPLVIQHEGRFKTHQEENRNTVHSVDSSLAELSVISGDVSLLTIKEARKF